MLHTDAECVFKLGGENVNLPKVGGYSLRVELSATVSVMHQTMQMFSVRTAARSDGFENSSGTKKSQRHFTAL